MNPQAKKPQVKTGVNAGLIEQLRDVGKGVTRSVTNDVFGGMTQDALSSLFGAPSSGTLRPGEPVQVGQNPPLPSSPYPESFKMPPFMPEMPFFPGFQPRQERPYVSPYSQETLNRLKEQEAKISQKIDEIRFELKALVATIKTVDTEVTRAVDDNMVDPGIYHLNFLDRLKTILKLLRQNLSDSASWLKVMRSRKKERKYWAMYKKKGTEFGLNPDRVVSTQVG